MTPHGQGLQGQPALGHCEALPAAVCLSLWARWKERRELWLKGALPMSYPLHTSMAPSLSLQSP